MMLYRKGGEFEWDGKPTDMLCVANGNEHEDALREGWRVAADYLANPLDHDGDGKSGGSLPRRGRPPKAREGGE